MNKLFLILFFLVLSFMISSAQSNEETMNKYTISGISSGGFLANQMAAIYSSEIAGVGTVAGGFYYCAQDYLPKKVKQDSTTIGTNDLFLFEPTNNLISDTLNPFIIFQGINPQSWFRPQKGNPIYQAVSVCMGGPENAELPTNYLKLNEEKKWIDPLINLSSQRAFIYQGSADTVLNYKMQERLKDYYLSVGLTEEKIQSLSGDGSHNFPTDRKDGIECDSEKVPYISSCGLNLAQKMLEHLLDMPLIRSPFDINHIYVVDQTQFQNKDLMPENWLRPTPSIAPYGYLYSSDKCLANPSECHLHVALHGCKMTDSYQESFQTLYQNQVNNYKILGMRKKKDLFNQYSVLPVIENKVNQYGLLKFVMDSGLIEYAEENNLMILFPQTWISEINYPYNPKGCWDWFGWTSENYATNQGPETSWLHKFIHSINTNPKSHILPVRPEFELMEKNFPRKELKP